MRRADESLSLCLFRSTAKRRSTPINVARRGAKFKAGNVVSEAGFRGRHARDAISSVKKEEGCGVRFARNLDRVSGNDRILL